MELDAMEFDEAKRTMTRDRIRERMRDYAKGDMIVAFSGGVDSSLLLKLACDAARDRSAKVYAVTVQTCLHPTGEIAHAVKAAREIGAVSVVLVADELAEAGIADNPQDRCYRCKKLLFQRIWEKAKELGVSVILEGTNEDDFHVYRPGLLALKELKILSPLAEAGLTKAEVRHMAREYGLSVSDRPAAPCLATRFPYGTRLSYQELDRVEKGEALIKEFGFYNIRLRIHGAVARLEVDIEEFPRVLEYREKITEGLQELGYTYITLDLEGFRSGSMDIGISSKNFTGAAKGLGNDS